MAELFTVNRTSGRRTADTRADSTDIPTALRVTAVVLGVVGVLWLLFELSTLILLLLFSILFAYLIAPLVAFVQKRFATGPRRKLSPGIAIGIVYLFIFGALALSLAWLVPPLTDQITQFPKQAPARIQSANAAGQSLSNAISRLRVPGLSAPIIERAVSAATSAVEAGAQRIATAFVHFAAFLPWLLLIPILAFFLLKDGAELKQGFLCLLPQARWRSHAAELFERMNVALAAYIRAQLVACLLIGIIVGVGFTLLRVPYAAILGIAAGLAEFVPVAGPFVIALVSVVVAGLHEPMLALWVLLFLGVLRVLEDYVIYPRLIGHNIHLHPLAVILAVLAGGELGGVVGVLLSVPALAISSVVYRYFVEVTGGVGASAEACQPAARERPPA